MSLAVLLPTDGSASALSAATWVSRHLAGEPLTVTLLHVMTPQLEYSSQDAFVAARRQSEQILEATERALGCCPSVETLSVIGVPHEEIVRYAIDHDIDLIVMGRRGTSPIEHWIGSVAFAVFQRSPVPVTIVEPERQADKA
ncbi:MAG: universal stress protein [Firmicutes bacterium]|nr:universal stress protein [Bacillota bacterium]